MAYRVTGAEVKEIFVTEMVADDLNPFIRASNTLINSYTDMLELSDTILFEIELWLAAHYASAKDQRIQYQSIGITKAKFQGEFKESFFSTDYGQRAMALDSTGTLEGLSLRLQTTSITAYPVEYPTTYADVDR